FHIQGRQADNGDLIIQHNSSRILLERFGARLRAVQANERSNNAPYAERTCSAHRRSQENTTKEIIRCYPLALILICHPNEKDKHPKHPGANRFFENVDSSDRHGKVFGSPLWCDGSSRTSISVVNVILPSKCAPTTGTISGSGSTKAKCGSGGDFV